MAGIGSRAPVDEGESGHQPGASADGRSGNDIGTASKGPENSNGKGKVEDTASIADRVQSSGKAIFKSVMSDRGIPDVATNGKGNGESSASVHSTTHQSVFGTEHQRNRQSSAMAQQSFRLDRGEHQTADAFEAFTAGESPKTDVGVHRSSPMETLAGNKSIMDQEALDGADVVDLLLRPDDVDSMLAQKSDELAPIEAARLQDALFGTGSTWPFWDQLLNFNPDFVVGSEDSGRNAEMHMGTSDTEIARSNWLRQWNDVLSSYTDEVWGDLGPLAAEAKRELEQCADTEEGSGPSITALARLRLILTHVRGH